MKNIDDIMHQIGFISGKLDVVGGSSESLVELCQECSKELSEIAEEYWKGKDENGKRDIKL